MEQKCVLLGHLLVLLHSDHNFWLPVISTYLAQWD